METRAYEVYVCFKCVGNLHRAANCRPPSALLLCPSAGWASGPGPAGLLSQRGWDLYCGTGVSASFLMPDAEIRKWVFEAKKRFLRV